MRKTKIVATVGPACREAKTIRRMSSLVDVFRINFSHGDRQSHQHDFRTIRREAMAAGKTIAILQDLPGPKIRVGKIANGSVELPRGAKLDLVPSAVEGTASIIPINYPELLGSVRRGDILHLADGIIRLRVEESLLRKVHCEVIVGGTLGSGKGVNAPGVDMKMDYPTARDVAHLKFGIAHEVDFVAASFVRSASDVRAVRRLLPSQGPILIAKIEKKEAVRNFDSILTEADGIMIARGDLGIEVPIESVPSLQNRIIRKCNERGKPVIVATQMLMSMVNFPVPSRAEVTDVSTAIQEGTDAVMLSDETTIGNYPVDSVLMLDRIARSSEKSPAMRPRPATEVESDGTGAAIARAACRLADYVGAKAIVAPTQTGTTARRVSMYGPRQPIIALCTESRVARRLKIYRGVLPVLSRRAKTVDWLFQRADSAAEELGLAKKGERIVVTSGTPGMKGTTNLIKVSVVGGRG